MTRILVARVPACLGLALACVIGCRNSADDGGTAAIPTYVWRGTLVDSATHAGVGGLVANVRERSEHVANGWNPYVSTGVASDGRFEIIYYLRGVYPCSAFPDTTLTLHLDFVDPTGYYAPATIQSDSFVVCPRVLPPAAQLPLNVEEGIRIALARS